MGIDTQQIDTSELEHFKPVKVIRTFQLVTGGVGPIGSTVAHNLGFGPGFIPFVRSSENLARVYFAAQPPEAATDVPPAYISYIDETNVRITYLDSGVTRTLYIVIYLYNVFGSS